MDGIEGSSATAATLALPPGASLGHLKRADSPGLGDERRGHGTGGRSPGTNGAAEIGACAAFILVAAAVCTVNALSILDDASRDGRAIMAWEPWATEYTSLAGSIVALPVGLAAAALIRRARLAWQRGLVALSGSLAFSGVHVATMVALRMLLWRFLGHVYHFNFGREWLYEYRKDALSYALLLAFLTIAAWLPPLTGRGSARPQPWPGRVRLADGRSSVEIDPATLSALRGGGNYVELIFVAGRRRLLRTTLDAAETALAGHGFRRTHKSWLVSLALVSGLERTQAGDFRLRLAEGLEVPLSRRSRTVLAEIRQMFAAARR
jgi:hypothetical protein